MVLSCPLKAVPPHSTRVAGHRSRSRRSGRSRRSAEHGRRSRRSPVDRLLAVGSMGWFDVNMFWYVLWWKMRICEIRCVLSCFVWWFNRCYLWLCAFWWGLTTRISFFDLFANNPEVLQIFTIAKNEPTVPSVLNKNIICMQRNSYCDWSWNREPFRRTVVQLYFPSGNDWGHHSHHKHSEFCVLALAGCWFHLLPLFHPYLPWVTGWFQWSMNPLIFHGHAIQIHWWNIPVKSHHMDPKWSKHQDTSWKATWPPQMPPFFFEKLLSIKTI